MTVQLVPSLIIMTVFGELVGFSIKGVTLVFEFPGYMSPAAVVIFTLNDPLLFLIMYMRPG